MVRVASITGWTRWAALMDVAGGVGLAVFSLVRPSRAKDARRRRRVAAGLGIAVAAAGIGGLLADRGIGAIVASFVVVCLAWTNWSALAASDQPLSGPAGWRPDPTGRHELRYWDGALWTMHVSDRGVPDFDLI
jgi:hypothetical protein